MFCTLWTLGGVPAVSLPLLKGQNGLPLLIQLVGRRGDDARLLCTARWLPNLPCSRVRSSAGLEGLHRLALSQER